MATPLSIALAARDRTQDDLAKAVDCSPAWIGELVRGRGRPSRELAARISDVLDVDADDLFGETTGIVVEFVRRTTSASGVPARLEDVAVADTVARALR